MSTIDDGAVSNHSTNDTFDDVIASRLSRRSVLGSGLAAAAAGTLGLDALLKAVPAGAAGSATHGTSTNTAASTRRTTDLIGFEPIDVTVADTVVVPPGYTAEVLISWGDPVSNGPAFKPDASNTSAEQEQQWGMHNDGVVYFPIDGSKRGLLVQNNEYTDDVLLFTDGTAGWNAEKTRKSQAAHGVSVIEVAKSRGRWSVVRPSRYARRITAYTPIAIGGPAAGDPRLRTSADPTGKRVLGTLNNCAMGHTPWGTYLACEENFNGYFVKTGTPTAMETRYGIGSSSPYLWSTTDSRFAADTEPNEPNRFGWVVEIDPFKPTSTPVKRTALGRLKHEGAWVQEARDGRVVVYTGDDERFEYIYRFVSRHPWRRARRLGKSPLDEGVLHVARFHANGTGEWLPLTPEHPALVAALRPNSTTETGWTMADILLFTRRAADLVGATKMDRPEWIDTFPDDLTAVATLTNNDRRGTGTNPATDAANPRVRNVYGHVITWTYRRDWTEPTFRWDIFALAGDPAEPTAGSTINGDKYGSPDGIYVAPSGRLWIQTDVSGSTINAGDYAAFGNNQMLCADPRTRETRRFLVGPRVCEVTGAFQTPDERTMFVGIQHPGEAPSGSNDPANPKQYSSWPDGPAGGRPRSSLVVITKDDGGKIGS